MSAYRKAKRPRHLRWVATDRSSVLEEKLRNLPNAEVETARQRASEVIREHENMPIPTPRLSVTRLMPSSPHGNDRPRTRTSHGDCASCREPAGWCICGKEVR